MPISEPACPPRLIPHAPWWPGPAWGWRPPPPCCCRSAEPLRALASAGEKIGMEVNCVLFLGGVCVCRGGGIHMHINVCTHRHIGRDLTYLLVELAGVKAPADGRLPGRGHVAFK